jgi:hypothetical protein
MAKEGSHGFFFFNMLNGDGRGRGLIFLQIHYGGFGWKYPFSK